MTDPRDPGEDDWGFPEVDPASTELPSAEPDEPVYDTGSDAWWRAQAEAQRKAAAGEPVVPPVPPAPSAPPPPPETVEAEVLNQAYEPTPLDETWVPPELPELRAPEPAQPEPLDVELPAAVWEEPEAVEDDVPTAWDDSLDDATTAYPADGEAAVEPVHELSADDTGELPAVKDEPGEGRDWYRGLVEADAAAAMPAAAPEPAEQEPVAREPYEPERVGPARALAGAALALAGVVLGVGALFVLNDDGEPTGTGPVVVSPTASVSASATPSPSASPSAAPTAASPTPEVVTTTPPVAVGPVVPVRVLNNSKVKGLADRAKRRFEAGGWPVPQTGNYRGGTIPVTTVYYEPGQQASAERFAKQFGIPRVAPRFAGIPVPGMTVILTRDYKA